MERTLQTLINEHNFDKMLVLKHPKVRGYIGLKNKSEPFVKLMPNHDNTFSYLTSRTLIPASAFFDNKWEVVQSTQENYKHVGRIS